LAGFDLGWFVASAGNLSAPRQTVLDIGGFDDGFAGVGLEGKDLAYSLARAGATAQINTEAASYRQTHQQHAPRGCSRRSLRYFAKKHRRLQAQLFLWWQAGGIDPLRANRIVQAAKRGRATADPVLAALDTAIDELLRLKLGR
jgi:hypothetical protein